MGGSEERYPDPLSFWPGHKTVFSNEGEQEAREATTEIVFHLVVLRMARRSQCLLRVRWVIWPSMAYDLIGADRSLSDRGESESMPQRTSNANTVFFPTAGYPNRGSTGCRRSPTVFHLFWMMLYRTSSILTQVRSQWCKKIIDDQVVLL